MEILMSYDAKVYRRHRLILDLLAKGRYLTAKELMDSMESRGENLSDRQILRILKEYCDRDGLDARPRTLMTGPGKRPTEYGWQRREDAPAVEGIETHQALAGR